MKVYFGFTVVGHRSTLHTARRIVHLLEELGHEVLTRHLVDEQAPAVDRSLGPQAVYQRDMDWLEQCELFLAEASGSSFGVGFEAGFLLGASQKEVILLYRRAQEDKLSLFITGNTYPNCTLVPYSSFAEVETFIRTSLS